MVCFDTQYIGMFDYVTFKLTGAWLLGEVFRFLPYVWFPLHFTSVKKIMESSVIFLQNGVLILNWKKNKEAGPIWFEIRIPRKKNKEKLWKFMEVISLWKKPKTFFGLSIIPNIITEKWGLWSKRPWGVCPARKTFPWVCFLF